MSSRQKRKQARRNGVMAAGAKSPARNSNVIAERQQTRGLAAKRLVLSTESLAEFYEMLLSYTRKFKPQDEVEMDLVNEMVAAQWRLQWKTTSERPSPAMPTNNGPSSSFFDMKPPTAACMTGR
jgi:hypothetical protein